MTYKIVTEDGLVKVAVKFFMMEFFGREEGELIQLIASKTLPAEERNFYNRTKTEIKALCARLVELRYADMNADTPCEAVYTNLDERENMDSESNSTPTQAETVEGNTPLTQAEQNNQSDAVCTPATSTYAAASANDPATPPPPRIAPPSKEISKVVEQVPNAAPASFKSVLLPNAMVGKNYEVELDKSFLKDNTVLEFLLDGFDPVGLKFDKETCILAGTPTVSGDFVFKLQFRQSTQIDTRRWCEKKIMLTVNPDPKSLWKDLPADRSDPYWKSDSANFGIAAANGRYVVAASQRGRSHAHEGKFRDDEFNVVAMENGWTLLTVADGAGSAKYSRRGSQIACEVCLKKIHDTVDQVFNEQVTEACGRVKTAPESARKVVGDALYNLVGVAAHAAFKSIQDEAKQKPTAVKDYATTLIVAITKKFDFGWFVGAYWVGDGGIGIYRKGESPRILGEPDGGEFAGQTRFLTMGEVWDPKELFRRLRFDVVEHFDALVLMTDGITDPKFESENKLKSPDKWDEMMDDLYATVGLDGHPEVESEKLLQWLDFWSPGNHDDRTIAILY